MISCVHGLKRSKRELRQPQWRVALLWVALGRQRQARDLCDHPAQDAPHALRMPHTLSGCPTRSQDAPHAPGTRLLQAKRAFGLRERGFNQSARPVHQRVPGRGILFVLVLALGRQQEQSLIFL